MDGGLFDGRIVTSRGLYTAIFGGRRAIHRVCDPRWHLRLRLAERDVLVRTRERMSAQDSTRVRLRADRIENPSRAFRPLFPDRCSQR